MSALGLRNQRKSDRHTGFLEFLPCMRGHDNPAGNLALLHGVAAPSLIEAERDLDVIGDNIECCDPGCHDGRDLSGLYDWRMSRFGTHDGPRNGVAVGTSCSRHLPVAKNNLSLLNEDQTRAERIIHNRAEPVYVPVPSPSLIPTPRRGGGVFRPARTRPLGLGSAGTTTNPLLVSGPSVFGHAPELGSESPGSFVQVVSCVCGVEACPSPLRQANQNPFGGGDQQVPRNDRANSEQLFGRSGLTSRRSYWRRSRAFRSAAPNTSSTASASRRLMWCWRCSAKRSTEIQLDPLATVYRSPVPLGGSRPRRSRRDYVVLYPRGVWYDSQGPQRKGCRRFGVDNRSLAEHSSRLVTFPTTVADATRREQQAKVDAKAVCRLRPLWGSNEGRAV